MNALYTMAWKLEHSKSEHIVILTSEFYNFLCFFLTNHHFFKFEELSFAFLLEQKQKVRTFIPLCNYLSFHTFCIAQFIKDTWNAEVTLGLFCYISHPYCDLRNSPVSIPP